MLVNRAALDGQVPAPERHERGLKAGSAVNDHELGPPQARASRSAKEAAQAAVLSPPMFLMAREHLCPSRRTPIAASTEMLVALRSSGS